MAASHPPKWGLRALSWFCPEALLESIEGDLEQQFHDDVARFGARAARRRFYLHVLRFCRPGIILRNKRAQTHNPMILWNSYLKISLRNMMRNKGYSLINIAGLAVGIASCLLIMSYILFEFSFDKTHPNLDRLYRVNQTMIWSPNGGMFSSTGPQVAFALQEDYPEIEAVTRINTPGEGLMRYDAGTGKPIAFRESNILAADSNFFSFFDIKLKEGNPATALVGVDKVVISDEVARKFFGDEPALGKMIQFENQSSTMLEVTGVTEHQPENMHFNFDYLLSIYTNRGVKRFEWSFIWTQVVTYARLKPKTDVKALEEKLQSIAPRRIAPSFVRMGMDYQDFVRDKGGWHFYLQPVESIRLHSGQVLNRFEKVGDIAYVYIFAAIGSVMLLMAAINFINLATARASRRALEVGIKKSLGAIKSNLIIQFQLESVLVCLLATMLAVVLAVAIRPVILYVTGFELPPLVTDNFTTALALAALAVTVGFLAGLYPSFYLTSFQPIQVLKGKLVAGMRSGGLRSALILIQFVIAIGMIAMTLVVQQQIRYMANKNLGLDKENVLVVRHADELGNQIESFRNEAMQWTGVKSASVATDVPGNMGSEDIFGAEGSEKSISISTIKADDQYLKTLGLQLLAGRNFSENSPADKSAIILNENAARTFGWSPEEAIGRKIFYPGGDSAVYRVVGVTRDFHFHSLHFGMSPLGFFSLNSDMWGQRRVVAVKYQTEDISALRSQLESAWSKLAPGYPSEINFYDQELELQYQNERKLSRLFSIFTTLSIAVGIIGLIGLIAYAADQKKKEIGIRKVFGASIPSIFILINRHYVMLMLVAMVATTPLCWLLLDKWLSSYAFRVTLSPMPFLIAGGVELAISLVCVSYLSLRAASLDPARVLKEE